MINIHPVGQEDNFEALSQLLNDSFRTVAEEFGLTKENSPTNNAFINGHELKSQLIENREFYYADNGDKLIGFIAIERSSHDNELFYIEKVAVRPAFRHAGIGEKLMNFAIDRIQELGGKKVSIALINSNFQLKEWYKKQGFEEISIKSYDHLPFDVCFMDKKINSSH